MRAAADRRRWAPRGRWPALVLAGIPALGLAAAGGLWLSVALWARSLPPISVERSGRAVVFFDGDVSTTVMRAQPALELVRRGLADRVFLVGGARPDRDFFGSEEVLDELRGSDGFESAQWTADRTSYDTITNLRAVLAWLADADSREPVFLVSDDYHLFRIRLLLDEERIAAPVVWVPSRERRTPLDHAARLAWEVGAWISTALPAPLRRAALDVTRE